MAQLVELPSTVLQIVETSAPTVQVVSGGLAPTSGSSGITSLNGQTGATQTFSNVDDTNVTLGITSSGDDHEFALGWTGELSLLRGGTGAANAAGARSNLGLGALAVLSTIGTAQIDNDAVTFDKTVNIAAQRLLGRYNAGSGNIEEITVGSGLNLSGAGVLTATAAGAGDVVGPASATDGAVTLFDGTTGKLLKNSTLTVAGNNLTITGTVGASNLSGTNTGDQDLSGLMVKANNLSDLTNAATGRTNLGVSTTANIAASTDKNYVTDAQLVVIGNTSGTNSGNVTLAGENYLSLAGQQITANAVDLSGTNVGGTLAAARFPALTGDVTNTVGTLATTIANDAVTTAKILDANVTLAKLVDASGASILLGRGSAGGAGDWQEITLGGNLTMTNQVLDAVGGGGGTPGGADTQVQYNDAGAFNGASMLSWDKVNNQFTLSTYAGSSNFTRIFTAASGGYALLVDATGGTGAGVGISTGTGVGAAVNTTTGKILTGAAATAITNTVHESISLYHNTSGAPATGFGVRKAWYAETSTTPDTPIVYTDAILANATHATRQGAFVISTALAGTPTEAIRIYRNSTTQTCSVIASLNNGGGLAVDVGTSGAFMLDVPNGSTSGGNARGTLAVDLQMGGRSAATEVASGTGAFACGTQNTASNDYTFVSGRNNIADRYHVRVHGGGGLGATPGAAQYGSVSWCRVTTDGTANLEMFLNGNSATARFTLANNSTVGFVIYIMARRTNGDGENACYKFEGAIKRDANAASTAIVGAVTKTVICEDTAAWDCQITADTTNGSLKPDVTGEVGKNINWVAMGHFVETRE